MIQPKLALKVCGMREESNVAAVGSLNPQYLGFIFVPHSPRYAGNLTREVVAGLPSSVVAVGVFRNAPLETVVSKVTELSLKGVQLHGEEDGEYLRQLRNKLPTCQILKAVGIEVRGDIEGLVDAPGIVDLFVLDNRGGGTGVSFVWEDLAHYKAQTPFLLAGGVGLENISEALCVAERIPQCAGFDINSRVEVSPGLKDVAKVRKFQERMMV